MGHRNGEEAPKPERAVRLRASGRVQGVFFRASMVERAEALGVMGWVRNEADGAVAAHAEGPAAAVQGLVDFAATGPAGASVENLEVEEVKPEGHEQFAVRGVSAGRFEVAGGGEGGGGFELRLEVDSEMRCWALPKAPSMDPAVKRMAFESDGAPRSADSGVWDQGSYEQGGRVPWPEAIERGHAVFVLHGAKLSGGFALQRIRTEPKPQWLLIKRRDEHARPS